MGRLMKLMALFMLLMFLTAGGAAAEGEAPPGIVPLPKPELSGSWVAGFIYVLLLVLLEYVPWFRTWWEKFIYKREAVAGFGLLVVVAMVGMHYGGVFDLEIGPFGWPVIGAAINTWLGFLGGAWLIWSLLNKAKALPRKVVEELPFDA